MMEVSLCDLLQLLLESLLSGAVTMFQFHVLVFSNARNIKDQETHPVIRVMNDFYLLMDTLVRPRIFAIFISIAGRKFHFDSGMLKLESALDAKVFGISEEKRAKILALPDRPSEMVILYGPPLRTAETRLFKQLRQFDPAEVLFRRQFRAARHTLAEVGYCASDLIWRRALKDIEANVSPTYDEDEDAQDQHSISPEKARSRIRDTVKNWVFTMPNLDPSSKGFNVTPKFAKLVQLLKSCKLYGDSFRGILFGPFYTRQCCTLYLTNRNHSSEASHSFRDPGCITHFR
jgi:endoribonuclease Dicer